MATVHTDKTNVLRVITQPYFNEYDHFMRYVYPELIEKGLIIPHLLLKKNDTEIIIEPERVPFISYPYEWSFAMLKEAALVTLRINYIAMKHGMMLKDASAYNIQYYKGRMVLIDTTSFMFYSGGGPWPSYPQFLRHFVNPLLWIKYFNQNMRQLSELYIDGIPTPLTNKMLPIKSYITNPRLLLHIWTQSTADILPTNTNSKPINISKTQSIALLASLYKLVKNLTYQPKLDRDRWIKYSHAGSYTADGINNKKRIVSSYFKLGTTVLDLGSNTGEYSKLASDTAYSVLSVDTDHDCIHNLYNEPNILPLIVDVCNPSPGIGWNNRERSTFWDRVGKVDMILALALIHHLSVSNNVPLDMVADLLAEHCNTLVIEWVPLEDKQAQKLLSNKNIPSYSHEVFINAFTRRFQEPFIASPVKDSGRIIYGMLNKER